MHYLTAFFAWIFEPVSLAEQRRTERYLSESADIFDLERRMRALDQGRAFGPYAHNG